MVLTRAKLARQELDLPAGVGAGLPAELQLRILEALASSMQAPDLGHPSGAAPGPGRAAAARFLFRLPLVCRAWREHLCLGGAGAAAASSSSPGPARSSSGAAQTAAAGAAATAAAAQAAAGCFARRVRLERLLDTFGRHDWAAIMGRHRAAGGRRVKVPASVDLPMPALAGGGGRAQLHAAVCRQLTASERRGLPGDALMLRVAADGRAAHVAAVMQLAADVHFLDAAAAAWAVIKLVPGAAAAAASQPAGGGASPGPPPTPDAADPHQQQQQQQQQPAAPLGREYYSLGPAERPTHALLDPYRRAFLGDPRLPLGMSLEVLPAALYLVPTITGFRRARRPVAAQP